MDVAGAGIVGLAGLASLGFLYNKIRPKFSIKVNCHFCSTDSKVPYNSKNSWICNRCDQYNGFTPDGNYNRPLGEDSVYRDRFVKIQEVLAAPDNGLCTDCNLNQQLKVSQMSSYQGEHGEDWERGVEDYARHLERVYRLCSRCQDVLRVKLNDQDSKLTPGLLAHRLETSRINNSLRITPKHSWLCGKMPLVQFMMSVLSFVMLLDFDQMPELMTRWQMPVEVTRWLPESLLCLTPHHTNLILGLHLLAAVTRVVRMDASRLSVLLVPLVLLQLVLSGLEVGHAGQLGLALGVMLLAVLATTAPRGGGMVSRSVARENNDRFSAELSNETRALRAGEEFEETMTQNLLSDSENSRNSRNTGGEESINQLVLNNTSNSNKEPRMFGETQSFNGEWPASSNSPQNYLRPSSFSYQSSHRNQSTGLNNSFLKRTSANSSFSHEFVTGKKQKDLDISSLSLGQSGGNTPDTSPFSRRLYSPVNNSGISFSPRRPLLRPAKMSARSWVAGGYWGHPGQANVFMETTLSRSSSQSSGFVSLSGQDNMFANTVSNLSPQNSPVNSFCGDWDRFSVLSEPIYRPKPTVVSGHLAPKAGSVVVGPSKENMLTYRPRRKKDKKYKKILQEEASSDSSVEIKSMSHRSPPSSPSDNVSSPQDSPIPNVPNSPWSLTITITAMNLALAASIAVNLGVAIYFAKHFVEV